MSTCNDIRYLIDVQDKNITFLPGCVTLGVYKKQPCKFISGELTYDPTHCEKCGVKNENYTVIKNGKQKSKITLPMTGTSLTFLKLLCKVAYGYRNFYNYKQRIMIHFKFRAKETNSIISNQKNHGSKQPNGYLES